MSVIYSPPKKHHMALKEGTEIILYCDFCGTEHPTKEAYMESKCAHIPDPLYKKGDIVSARFTKGVGMCATGEHYSTGQIIAINTPLTAGEMGECPAKIRHSWVYKVKPLTQPETNEWVHTQNLPEPVLSLPTE